MRPRVVITTKRRAGKKKINMQIQSCLAFFYNADNNEQI